VEVAGTRESVVNQHNDRKGKVMLQPEPGRLARPMATPPSGWQRWLPGARLLLHYEPAWLPNDVLAGLVLPTMLVPTGIAYAEAPESWAYTGCTLP
jgi:hypothetical protein